MRWLLCETLHMTERYLRTGAAARALKMAESTLRAGAREGRLTPAGFTPGGHYLWDLEDLSRQLKRLNEKD